MKIENTDRIIFKKGKQSEFIRLAAKEIGSLRGLARFVNKRWGYFWYYVNEEISLPYNLFESILPMTPLTKDEVMATWVKEVRLRNWGNVIGGKKTGEIVKKKIKEDKKFRERWRKNCRKGGNKLKSKFIKNWRPITAICRIWSSPSKKESFLFCKRGRVNERHIAQ